MGSLFKLRDFWSTSFPDEEFGVSAVTVGDIENVHGADKIAVGSFHGHLRILEPSTERGEMQPNDLLYEKKFEEPILQIECGPFEPVVDGVTENLLAVLFPRRLLMLRFFRMGDSTPSASGRASGQDVYYNCSTSFDTVFEHSTCNFVSGRFGKAYYKLICVQSMDGQLTIVDFNKIAYVRVLPTTQFLVPGCLSYCASKDCFLTNSSALFLQCYSYTSLINAAPAEDLSAGGSRVKPMWTYNLGDDAVGIEVCPVCRGSTQENIVVLSPYKMHILDDFGEMITLRRLNAEAICLRVYPLPELDCYNVVVGFMNGSISIFSDVALEWSATVTSGIPQCISIGQLCGVNGMIVVLDAENTLSVNYLGTDPADGPIVALESETQVYSEMCQELLQIQAALRDGTGAVAAAPSAPTAVSEEKMPASIIIAPPVSENKEATVPAEPVKPPNDLANSLSLVFVNNSSVPSGGKITVSLLLKLEATTLLGVLTNIEVYLHATQPIVCETGYKRIPQIEPGETVTIPVTISCPEDTDHIIPSSLEISAFALFKHKNGGDHLICRSSMRAPLSLVAQAVDPVKNPAFSVQINTEKSPPPSLIDLFPDMSSMGPVSPNVLSLKYVNGADATILVSKNAARFKIQGSTMEGLWLVSDELIRRIRTYYHEPQIDFSIPDDVPMSDFCAVVETHVAVRRELSNAKENLERAANFFRAVEKRLITHFRDRNPSNLDALDVLLKESYKNLLMSHDGVMVAQTRLRQACAMLNCCARLFCLSLLVQNKTVFTNEDDRKTLEGIFSCETTDSDGVGWEEMTEIALVKLLDIKTAKVGAKNVEVSLKTLNLKKYIRSLVEHVKEGKRLTC